MAALLAGLSFAGLVLLLGGTFARRWLTPSTPRLRWLGAGLGLLLLGWCGQVTVTLTTLGFTAPADVLAYLTTTGTGRSMLLGSIGALVLLAAETGGGKWPVSLGAALVTAWGVAGVGHAAGHGSWVQALHAAHTLAMSVWVGGVLAVLRARPLNAALARRFTPVALGSVLVLTVTGLLMSGEHLTTPAQWLGSLYGQVLLVKLALVALAVGAAVLVRRAFAARRPQVRLHLAREALVLVAVLGVTAVLTTQPPPQSAHPAHGGPP
ncbi:CopD family protein [Deinococcus sp. 6YEL10]|uniref:CopD family protein n=1 Tax=Deinococcus sp. 6YEL10 TaxID=2745870 RepID=UPI001E4ABBAF|nr:CopD family protein [Deinococcus sp. 6YEL10]MCD0160474.1 CopD family protein [Deinococcus sp. 6YEL10]